MVDASASRRIQESSGEDRRSSFGMCCIPYTPYLAFQVRCILQSTRTHLEGPEHCMIWSELGPCYWPRTGQTVRWRQVTALSWNYILHPAFVRFSYLTERTSWNFPHLPPWPFVPSYLFFFGSKFVVPRRFSPMSHITLYGDRWVGGLGGG